MITEIKLKNVATFDSDKTIEIRNLKKVNFIYGANGTGKTTISNFLYDEKDIKYSECELSWENDSKIDTLIYNKKFREDHFGNNSKLNGVFTLGKATKDEIELIDSKKVELKNYKEQYTTRKKSLEKAEQEKEEKVNTFREKVWKTIYHKFKGTFKEAFLGAIKSKDLFYKRVLKECNDNSSPILTLDELKIQAETIFGENPKRIDPFTVLEYGNLIDIENDEIWKTKIIGKADVKIAKLIQKLNINDWVIKGKEYLKQTNKTCPFCQEETITESFKNQLEDFFDEDFTNNLKTIKEQKNEYLRLASNIVNQLNEIENSEKENSKTKLNFSLFSANLKTLISEFSVNKEILQNKESEPSRNLELKSVKEQLDSINTLIQNANQLISEHNKIVADYDTKKTELIGSIWKYLVEENKVDLNNHINEVTNIGKSIDGIKKQYDDFKEKHRVLKVEIDKLSLDVTSSEPTVIQINNTLKSYGFNNFTIVKSVKEKNHYEIQREDGTLAESTLSEGEVTFITFLYYLQIVKGSLEEGKISDDKILVIDDPISSLDSSILYIVSTLIKDIIRKLRNGNGNVLQVILLTHNVFFHKEVSFIDGRTTRRNDTHYWILRKVDKLTSVQEFEQENPIHSSYELLWKELKNESNLVSVQNTMRRIIENYFRLLGKYRDDRLIGKFETKEDQDICRSLISWINDGSHTINDDLFIEYQDDTIDKYKKIFKAIFEKTKHLEHYKMMMQEEIELEATT